MTRIPDTLATALEELLTMTDDEAEKWAAQARREASGLMHITCDKCLDHFLPPHLQGIKGYTYDIPQTQQSWTWNVNRATVIVARDHNPLWSLLKEDMEKLIPTITVEGDHVQHLSKQALERPVLLATPPRPVPGFSGMKILLDGSHRLAWHYQNSPRCFCYVLTREQSIEALWGDLDTFMGIRQLAIVLDEREVRRRERK